MVTCPSPAVAMIPVVALTPEALILPLTGGLAPPLTVPAKAVVKAAPKPVGAVKPGRDALLNKFTCVTVVLVMADFRATNMSSLALPAVGVNVVVMGLVVLSGVSSTKAVRSLLSAVSTEAWVIGATAVGVNESGVNPVNQTSRLDLPTTLATIKSVSGVMFTVPKLVAREWYFAVLLTALIVPPDTITPLIDPPDT